jgi:DNA adenine methylase
MTSSIMGYYGSKHRCADWLISLMPPHLGYVEPFAGSLSIRAYGRDPKNLLYVDPPYLGSTRTGSTDGYALEMRSEDQHRALAEVLVECKAMVLLSGYASPLYDDLFEGWERHEFATWTGQGNSRAARTEVAWANYRLELSLGVEGGA